MAHDPLTSAQVALIQERIAERQQYLLTTVEGLIAESVAPLQVQVDALTAQVATMQEALAVLDAAAIKAALRSGREDDLARAKDLGKKL